jgi:hypothetical protein
VLLVPQGCTWRPRFLLQHLRMLKKDRLIMCHSRMAAPAQPQPENNGMEFKKRARPEILEEEKKDPEDDEPDFG